jgi:hypothetical protein
MVSHWMGDQNLLSQVLRASKGTLSRWFRLHLQSLALQFQGGLTSGKRPVVKIIAESLPHHDEKQVFTPLSVGKG